MQEAFPAPSTTAAIRRAAQLGRSTQNFLSVYLPTEPAEALSASFRLRLSALLDAAQDRYAEQIGEDKKAMRPFLEERERLEAEAINWRPGGYGLAVLSSLEAGVWQAFWLPIPVPEHAQYGRGAYVLPLLDALDELEPVALAQVARDMARLHVFTTGKPEEQREVESEVPRPTRAGSGAATIYGGTADNTPLAQRPGGDASADRWDNHIMAHVEGHLKQVAQELEQLRQRHKFRRLFVSGPTEPATLFRNELSNALSRQLAGELSLSNNASEREIREALMQASQEKERAEELEVIEEVITRSEKQQGAVLGIAATMSALNRRELHNLIMAQQAHVMGGYCSYCELALPPETIRCPQCDAKPIPVDLAVEAPRMALEQNLPMEIVHGDAAVRLMIHEGFGGLLTIQGER